MKFTLRKSVPVRSDGAAIQSQYCWSGRYVSEVVAIKEHSRRVPIWSTKGKLNPTRFRSKKARKLVCIVTSVTIEENPLLGPRLARTRSSNLVDSASSHTLVSKIKPCMSKYKYSTLKLRMAHYISYSLFDSPLLLG